MGEQSILSRWQQRLRDDRTLSANARLAGMMVSTYADADGTQAYPSYATLAQAMGKGRSQAAEGVRELAEAGWLMRVQRGRRRHLLLILPDWKQAQPVENLLGSPARRTAPVRPTGRHPSGPSDKTMPLTVPLKMKGTPRPQSAFPVSGRIDL